MNERQVLITGVSRGLGLGLLRAHLEDGWHVLGVGRSEPPETGSRQRFSFLELDLSRPERIRVAVHKFTATHGRPNRVVLNAGVLGAIQDLRDTGLEQLRSIMDVNLWANKELLDVLCSGPQKPDQVIAISSGASINGHRGWGGYAISKAALNMLIQLYAAEVPETHFVSLAPGLIDTAMQDYMYSEPDVEKFPSVQRLRDARYTDAMPGPDGAARRIMQRFADLREYTSGSFVDIRKMK